MYVFFCLFQIRRAEQAAEEKLRASELDDDDSSLTPTKETTIN